MQIAAMVGVTFGLRSKSTLPFKARNRMVSTASQPTFLFPKLYSPAPTLADLPVYAMIWLPDDFCFGVHGIPHGNHS